jgi:hypothetical protein
VVVYNSKDYWRMDVNNDGKFSVADLYYMLAYMNGVVTQYTNTTPSTKFSITNKLHLIGIL